MRDLLEFELEVVSGGARRSPHGPSHCPSKYPSRQRKKGRKGNNGFGNNGRDGSPNGKQDDTR